MATKWRRSRQSGAPALGRTSNVHIHYVLWIDALWDLLIAASFFVITFSVFAALRERRVGLMILGSDAFHLVARLCAAQASSESPPASGS